MFVRPPAVPSTGAADPADIKLIEEAEILANVESLRAAASADVDIARELEHGICAIDPRIARTFASRSVASSI